MPLFSAAAVAGVATCGVPHGGSSSMFQSCGLLVPAMFATALSMMHLMKCQQQMMLTLSAKGGKSKLATAARGVTMHSLCQHAHVLHIT
jgi:hypothetical protein